MTMVAQLETALTSASTHKSLELSYKIKENNKK